jgi:HPt (histidine-containing phosphotransfer) domain-containing protein
MTAHTGKNNIELAYAAGMVGFIAKPINLDKLFLEISTHIAEYKKIDVTLSNHPRPNRQKCPEHDSDLVDLKQLSHRLGGNCGAAMEAVRKFYEYLLIFAQRLKDAYATGDIASVKLDSHTLKGTAANMGAHRLYRSAKDLYDICKSDAPVDLKCVEDVYNDLLDTIKEACRLADKEVGK